MRPAVEAAGRRLGLTVGSHNLEGSVYALESDYARSCDAPPWSRLTRSLAVGPAVAVLFAVLVATSILASMLRRAGPRPVASLLTYSVGGFILGDLLARRRHTLARVWRLDTPGGARVVRISIPPSHASDVRLGDVLHCWVRVHRDGSCSADLAENLMTGERITPLRPSALLVFTATAWMAVLVVVVLHALVAHA